MRRTPTRSATAFAAGIAVTAASAFTFQAFQVSAIDDGESTFVPTTPCRLFDFRPDPDNVGPRDTPLGPNETTQVQITGTEGDCDIPPDATAISMNVTALNATAPSFLQLWPADEAQPDTGSSLNYVPGQAPTPNKVDVKLSPTGAIDVYNLAGTVDVLGDVVGYYTNSGLQELAAGIAALQAEARPFTVDSGTPNVVVLGTAANPSALTTVGAVEVDAPVDGRVLVSVAGDVIQIDNSAQLACSIQPNNGEPPSAQVAWQSPSGGDNAAFTIEAGFDVEAATSTAFRVVCFSGSPIVGAASVELFISATFWPS